MHILFFFTIMLLFSRLPPAQLITGAQKLCLPVINTLSCRNYISQNPRQASSHACFLKLCHILITHNLLPIHSNHLCIYSLCSVLLLSLISPFCLCFWVYTLLSGAQIRIYSNRANAFIMMNSYMH